MAGIEYIRFFEIYPGVDHLLFKETFPAPVIDGGTRAPQQLHGFGDLYQFVFLGRWLQLGNYSGGHFFGNLLNELPFVDGGKDHVIHIRLSFGLWSEYGHKLAGVVSWGSTPSFQKPS